MNRQVSLRSDDITALEAALTKGGAYASADASHIQFIDHILARARAGLRADSMGPAIGWLWTWTYNF